MLFISHDLAVVSHVSDRVAVMYLGKLCEIGTAGAVYATPAHPYTAALLASVPEPDPDVELVAPALSATVPSPIEPPAGCRFATRCPAASSTCRSIEPAMREVESGHFVACHHPRPPFEGVVSVALNGNGRHPLEPPPPLRVG